MQSYNTACRHVFSMEISNGSFRAIKILFKFGKKKKKNRTQIRASIRYGLSKFGRQFYSSRLFKFPAISVFRFRLFIEVVGNVDKRRSEHVYYKCILGVE